MIKWKAFNSLAPAILFLFLLLSPKATAAILAEHILHCNVVSIKGTVTVVCKNILFSPGPEEIQLSKGLTQIRSGCNIIVGENSKVVIEYGNERFKLTTGTYSSHILTDKVICREAKFMFWKEWLSPNGLFLFLTVTVSTMLIAITFRAIAKIIKWDIKILPTSRVSYFIIFAISFMIWCSIGFFRYSILLTMYRMDRTYVP